MGFGLRPGAKAPDEPPTPYRLRASPRLYLPLCPVGGELGAVVDWRSIRSRRCSRSRRESRTATGRGSLVSCEGAQTLRNRQSSSLRNALCGPF